MATISIFPHVYLGIKSSKKQIVFGNIEQRRFNTNYLEIVYILFGKKGEIEYD